MCIRKSTEKRLMLGVGVDWWNVHEKKYRKETNIGRGSRFDEMCIRKRKEKRLMLGGGVDLMECVLEKEKRLKSKIQRGLYIWWKCAFTHDNNSNSNKQRYTSWKQLQVQAHGASD